MARKGSPDIAQAKALITKAEGRIKFSIKSREINENTASYIFEDISVWSYLIVGFVWLLLTTFLIYYVFAEVEEILNKLYKVEV